MLALKGLELSGFKSFAQKVRLEFKTSITAIVGPNGSGKSNVAEALRFVLGEQSMKSMRGRRTEDLIWNGSPKLPRQGRASVKLTFDNTPSTRSVNSSQATLGPGSRLFDIDFEEVVIERVIHRDAVSEYKVNGSVVRLKDILEMLSSAHIGSSGHHIISQGETDRILLVNPRERKVMLEDALGLTAYIYKKEESERKLQKTEENAREVELLRREIKPHLKFLESQVEKIKAAEDLRVALQEKYREYFAREAVYVLRTREEFRGARGPLEGKLNDLLQKLSGEQKKLEELGKHDEAIAHIAELERERAELLSREHALTREIGKLEGEQVALTRLADREAALESENIPLVRVRSFVSELESRITEAESGSDLSYTRRVLAEIKIFVSGFFTEGGNATSKDETAERRAELDLRHTELEGELNTVRTDRASKEGELAESREAREARSKEEREAERAIFALSEERGATELALNDISGKEEALKLIEEEYIREREEARALVGEEALGDSGAPPSDEPRESQEARKHQIERLKIRLEDAGTSSSGEFLKEYEEVQARDAFLERELADLEASRTSLRELIVGLEGQLENMFKEGVEKVNDAFKDFFGTMFGGGEASLELVREEHESEEGEEPIVEEGVIIRVSLPRKKIRSLEMLSGGERALVSVALLFALSQVNPPPFLVLDETDAALDEANSKRYGDMVERLAERSQLILITHNRETMSRAGVLYGVTMGALGASQVLSVAFDEAVRVAK